MSNNNITVDFNQIITRDQDKLKTVIKQCDKGVTVEQIKEAMEDLYTEYKKTVARSKNMERIKIQNNQKDQKSIQMEINPWLVFKHFDVLENEQSAYAYIREVFIKDCDVQIIRQKEVVPRFAFSVTLDNR